MLPHKTDHLGREYLWQEYLWFTILNSAKRSRKMRTDDSLGDLTALSFFVTDRMVVSVKYAFLNPGNYDYCGCSEGDKERFYPKQHNNNFREK